MKVFLQSRESANAELVSLCLSGLFVLFTNVALGQNLVPNSGFEEYVHCPKEHVRQGQKFSLPGWYSPSLGTPDYFNECSPRFSKATENWAGICRDHSGNGYTGIIAFMSNKSYREYLCTELMQPLDSGVTYHLQFSFRLSSYCKVSSGKLGIALSNERVNVHHDGTLNLEPALLTMLDSGIVVRTGLWQMASADYVAKGGEKFLIIGNFFSASETPTYRIQFNGNHEPMLATASYYYIDDVIVQRQVEFLPDLPLVAADEDIFEADSVFTLRNVQFAYNSALLNKVSEPELLLVKRYLEQHADVRLEIAGHTDDQGTDAYNLDLSQRRASAVRKFLIDSGIAAKRLIAKGYGKSWPLINQTDEPARALNRRVEVRLLP
jgi:OOP family OmpA-OmpF porin